MDIMGIISATAVIGTTGLLIGLFLSFASKKFYVHVDEAELGVRELLPGNNCGGCGYAGCDALAKAMVNGSAMTNACPVAGSDVAKEISVILGVDLSEKLREVAFVKCAGDCNKSKQKYDYYGEADCNKLAPVPGNGPKECTYGCSGYGSCVKVCNFGAIDIINGIAVINKELCKACGLCINTCPKHLIELVPYDSKIKVNCNSLDKGKETKSACSVGCIGCKICVKACEEEAIIVENNLAHIDYGRCTGCGNCKQKCPTGAIT